MRRLASTLEEQIHAALRVSAHGSSLGVTIEPNQRPPLGLLVHKGERDAIIRRIKKQFGTSGCNAGELRTSIARELVALARKPISLRNVERLLAITSAERTRWTKCGRLPVSGSTVISKGPNRITLPTYSPLGIEKLLQTPGIAEGWRSSDREDLRLA